MNCLENTKSSLLKDGVSDPQNTVYATDNQNPGNKKQSRRNHGHESKQSKQEKEVKRNASSVVPITLTIERNVQLLGRLGKQGHFAIKCQEKNRVSLVHKLTRYITQVQRQDMQKVVNQYVSQHLTLMSLSLPLNVSES